MDSRWKSFGVVSRAVVLCALLLSCHSAFATTVRCDDCSVAGMQYAAESGAAKANNYIDPVYVVNLTANAVIKYSISRTTKPSRTKGEPPEVTITATAIAPEAEVAAFVSAAYEQTLAKDSVVLPQGPALPGSVYDHINQPSYDVAVSEYVDLHLPGAVRRFADALRAVNPFSYFKPDALTVKSSLHYADGSSAILVFDYKLGRWVRLPGSERDSQNNLVPITVQDFAGGSTRIYDFSGANSNQDLLNFLNRAVLLGVPVTGAVGGRVAHCTVVLGGVSCTFTF